MSRFARLLRAIILEGTDKMGRRIFAIVITALSLTFLTVTAGAATGKSAVGSWKLDLGKSSYEKMAAPAGEKLVVMTDKPDAIKWLLTGATSDGKTYVSMYEGPVDGQAHPYGNNAVGNTISYMRSPSGLEWTVKDKNGAVIEMGVGQVSADGNTLTIKGSTVTPNGKGNFVSVFDRVQ